MKDFLNIALIALLILGLLLTLVSVALILTGESPDADDTMLYPGLILLVLGFFFVQMRYWIIKRRKK